MLIGALNYGLRGTSSVVVHLPSLALTLIMLHSFILHHSPPPTPPFVFLQNFLPCPVCFSCMNPSLVDILIQKEVRAQLPTFLLCASKRNSFDFVFMRKSTGKSILPLESPTGPKPPYRCLKRIQIVPNCYSSNFPTQGHRLQGSILVHQHALHRPFSSR